MPRRKRAKYYDPQERLRQIDADLAQLTAGRRARQKELQRLSLSELLTLADQRGLTSIRGTGPRSRPRASDVIGALLDEEMPIGRLERERRRVVGGMEDEEDDV